MKRILIVFAALAFVAGGMVRCAQSQDALPVIPPPGSNLPALLPSEGPAEPVPNTPLAPTSAAPTAIPIETLPDAILLEDEIVVPPEPLWYESAYWFGPVPWNVEFELGLNGSAGTNDTLSTRAGGHLKRETDFWKIDSNISLFRNTSNSVETQNNTKFDTRLDRMLGKSPWTLYFLTNVLYDEFQAFNLRLAMSGGLGYQFIDTKRVDLVGRFGGGSSREFGGPSDRWAEEVLFGLEYEHEFSKTQRFTAKVDYFPEWKDFGLYRVVTDIGWEIDLDRPRNVSLKLSAIDRYDSTPDGVQPNNLDYALLLIWGL